MNRPPSGSETGSTGLVAWKDKNGDGKIQFAPGDAFAGKIAFAKTPDGKTEIGKFGEMVVSTPQTPIEKSKNEFYVDQDIMVLANPEIAKLPNWWWPWWPLADWPRPSPLPPACSWSLPPPSPTT